MPQISIIVPVFKVESYIHACLDSILAQTFQDFELILVDDGSPDRSGTICDEYAQKDSRVRVIHQKNSGLSCARNTGIDAATGNYLCFADSDDLLDPDFLQILFELLDGTDFDFSFCGVHRFQDGTEPAPEDGNGTASVTNIEYLKMQFERRTEFGVWNKLFRRELFEHIRFMSGKLHEDVIFSADLVRHLHRGAVHTNRQLYYYRQRQGSIMSTHTHHCSPDLVFAGEYLLNTVNEICPELTEDALRYTIAYPWMFVDPIYVKGAFRDSQELLDTIQSYLKKYMSRYQYHQVFPEIQTRRMELFAKSRILYACNAYARLARVYLYRLIGKDAYQDGHGI